MGDFKILIQKWYRLNKRNLPWRNTNDPYFIWLSEIILQQTRVEQGLTYYENFIKTFPTVQDLASAEEDEVLNLWQGLGYYSRARNLHKAAKQVVDQYKGLFPNNYSDLLQLKGVGDYTASAVASIAFDLPHAVVDGNVYRVLSRYMKIEEPIDTGKGKKIFKEVAQELLDPDHPGDYNQAVMELGALICLPKNPLCEICPVVDTCLARAEGIVANLPIKAKKTKVRNRFFNYYVITDGKNLYLKKRGKGDIWQGLYDFPLYEGKNNSDSRKREWMEKFNGKYLTESANFTHLLSHQKIYARFFVLVTDKITKHMDYQIVAINDLEDFPLPQLLIRYIKTAVLFAGE